MVAGSQALESGALRIWVRFDHVPRPGPIGTPRENTRSALAAMAHGVTVDTVEGFVALGFMANGLAHRHYLR
jgi:hypothetical protein